MLVLSRKVDEGITIIPPGCDDKPEQHIHLIVVDIRGDKVRFGTQAPPEVKVHRDEVWEAIQRSQQIGRRVPLRRGLRDLVASQHTPSDDSNGHVEREPALVR